MQCKRNIPRLCCATCEKARCKKARLCHRRKTQMLHQKRLAYWALGHTNRRKAKVKHHKKQAVDVLPSPLWWPWTQDSHTQTKTSPCQENYMFSADGNNQIKRMGHTTGDPHTKHKRAHPDMSLPCLRDFLESDANSPCDTPCNPRHLWQQQDVKKNENQRIPQQNRILATEIANMTYAWRCGNQRADKTCSSQSFAHHSSNLTRLRQTLRGGAGGASRTKRIRKEQQYGWWNDTTHSNQADQSLANALANVLQNWQPGNQTSQTNAWQNRQKRRKTDQSTKPQGGLREQLLQVLQRSQNASDDEVAQSISALLQPFLQPPQRKVFQTAETYPGPAKDKGNRWSKPRPTKQINHAVPPIIGLVSSEWTATPVLWSATDLLKAIKEGKTHPTANITAVSEPAEAKQIEQVWKAYGQEGFWTLILTGQAKSLPNATPATIRTFRAKQPIRIEEVALLFLGDATKAVKTKPITKIPSSSWASIQRTTIRIAAPSDFREPFLETPDKPRLVVQELAQWVPQLKASALTGGRWSEKTFGWKTILTGFVDLPSKDAMALTQHSGKRGIFVSVQDSIPTHKPITWISRQADESNAGYLTRSLKQATDRKVGLFHKKGDPKHCLGLPATSCRNCRTKSQTIYRTRHPA